VTRSPPRWSKRATRSWRWRRSRAAVTSPHSTHAAPGSRSATARPGPLRASGVRGRFGAPCCRSRLHPSGRTRAGGVLGFYAREIPPALGSVRPRARRSRPRRRGRAPRTGADRS
jgi:hypothetical protein